MNQTDNIKRIFLLLFLLNIFIGSTFAQSTIWEEDFDSYAANTGVDGQGAGAYRTIGDYPDDVTWTLDVDDATLSDANDYFKVTGTGNYMAAQDTDGDVFWFSETFDISCFIDIVISLDYAESGGLESADEFEFSYQLDGNGIWVQIGYHDDDLPQNNTAYTMSNSSSPIAEGTTLQLRVRAINSGDDERWLFDNIEVEGTETPFDLASEFTNITCYGDDSGTITLTASCGTEPYEYQISDGTNTYTNSTGLFTNLSAATYSVQVTDDNGSGATETDSDITIEEPSSALSIAVSNVTINCSGNCEAEFDYTISGGEAPYFYTGATGTSQIISWVDDENITDFQVQIEIPYAAGMNNDFSNLRFYTDETESTPLDYFVETYTSGTTATVWVETSVVSGSNSIYMSYDNPMDASLSDIADVMNNGGLNVEYYNNTNLSGSPDEICVDEGSGGDYANSVIDVWNTSSLGDCSFSDNDGFSLRWSGWIINPNTNSNLDFQVWHDDGLVVDIEGNQEYSDWGGGYENDFFTVPLTSDTFSIQVEYYVNSGNMYNSIAYYNDGSSGWYYVSDWDCFYRDIPSTEIDQADFTFKTVGSASGTITAVCSGSYTFEVTDSWGCTVDTTFNVPVDLANPVVTAPNDIILDISDTVQTSSTDILFSDDFDVAPGSNGWAVSDGGNNLSVSSSYLLYNGDDGESYITRSINTEGYKNIIVSIEAYQNSGTRYEATEDYLRVGYNDGSGWSYFTDDCIWANDACVGNPNGQGTPTEVTYSLPSSTFDISNLSIRISFETDADAEDYFVTSFYITGLKESVTINDFVVTGTATATDSVYTEVGIEIDYTETVEYFCDSSEIVIHRTWTGTDSCGNVGSDLQEISFGTAPTITCPDDTIIGPCGGSHAFVLPTFGDNCGVRSLTNDFSVTDWKDDSDGLTNAYLITGDTTITWIVADSSYAKTSCTQNVTLADSIKPSIDIAPAGEICDGTEITFTVNLEEAPVGSLSYEFQVNDGGGFVTVQNGASASYTSSSIGDNYEVRVYVTDAGTLCVEEANVSMDIKPNIKTNLIVH